MKATFTNGKVVFTDGGATLANNGYVECDGVIYYVINNQIANTPAFWVDAQTGNVYEYTENTIEIGNTTILTTTVKHCYTLVQNG